MLVTPSNSRGGRRWEVTDSFSPPPKVLQRKCKGDKSEEQNFPWGSWKKTMLLTVFSHRLLSPEPWSSTSRHEQGFDPQNADVAATSVSLRLPLLLQLPIWVERVVFSFLLQRKRRKDGKQAKSWRKQAKHFKKAKEKKPQRRIGKWNEWKWKSRRWWKEVHKSWKEQQQ